MGLIPGDSGQKAIFADGMQIDRISENTAYYGVLQQGRTSGTSVPIGYVSEILTGTVADVTVSASGTIYSVGSIPLTKGLWLVLGQVCFGYSSISSFGCFDCGIGSTASTFDEFGRTMQVDTGYGCCITITPYFYNLSTDTTKFLNGRAYFSGITAGRLIGTGAPISSIRAIRIG